MWEEGRNVRKGKVKECERRLSVSVIGEWGRGGWGAGGGGGGGVQGGRRGGAGLEK